jgi:hypothetical protein
MTNFVETNHRRGVSADPTKNTNTGSFALKPQTFPELSLNGQLWPTVFTVNDAFPIPQANDLDKIVALVDAVNSGANTGEAVAETFEMSGRQGPYYADAAGYLGLVDTIHGANVRTYELTTIGQQMLASAPGERVALIRELIASTPAVQILSDDGQESMLDFLSEAGLNDGTSARRGACASSWVSALGDSSGFENSVQDALGTVRDRAGAAAAHAATRAEFIAAAKREPVAEICTGCFMVKSVSGDCGC